MYAIIRSGGKQYRVEPGDRIRVEKIDAKVGSEIVLNEVVFIGGSKVEVGTPVVKNAQVDAIVLKQDKFPKIVIFKKKRRQGYRRTWGHRQPFTELFIKAVSHGTDRVEAQDLPLIKETGLVEESVNENVVASVSDHKEEVKDNKNNMDHVASNKTSSKNAKAKQTNSSQKLAKKSKTSEEKKVVEKSEKKSSSEKNLKSKNQSKSTTKNVAKDK